MTLLPYPERGWLAFTSAWLAATLAIAVLLMWLPERWLNPTIFQTGVLVLALVWTGRMLLRPVALRFSSLAVLLCAATAWSLLQLAARVTVSRWDTWISLLNWIGYLAAFLLSMQVCSSQSVQRPLLDHLLSFGFGLSVFAVLQYFSSGGTIFWFYSTDNRAMLGPFVSPDRYAAFIELILPLAIVRMLSDGRGSLKYAVMGAAMYASVIAGASRAGALIATAELITVPAAARASRYFSTYNLRVATVRLWGIAAVFTAVVGWLTLWNRLQDPNPFRVRREILASTISMAKQRPYFGFGLGTFPIVYPKYALADFGAEVNHAHNDWAEWAAEGGVPFALFLLAVAVGSVVRAAKAPWGIGVVAVFLHSVVDFPLQDPVIAVWLFALAGVLAGETTGRTRWLGQMPLVTD